MISFELFTIEQDIPIYAQILRFIKSGITSGRIKNGDELPSRRVLSALLGINPNTVQKACRMLEEEGIIESRSGAKSFVAVDTATVERLRAELMAGDILSAIAALKRAGITKEQAISLIEQNWEGG